MFKLYHTPLGGWLVHCITVMPWLFGALLPIFGIVSLLNGQLLTGAVVLAVLSYQYLLPTRKWKPMGKIIKNLDPRCFYDQCELHFDCKLDTIPNEKRMLAYHPHGALCVGFSWNGAHSPELEPKGFAYLVVDMLTKAPLFGMVLGWLGNIKGASSQSMKKLMSKGTNIALVPGGFEDATIMKHGVERVFLKKRKGFIKYALQFGYWVHPVYTFGENDSFYTFHWFAKSRMWLNRFKIPAVFFFGEPWFPVFPRRHINVQTYVGDPLQLPHLPTPTEAQVDEWHGKYCEELTKLFNKHKKEAGYGDRELDLW